MPQYYLATIKIPIEIDENGSIIPYQDRHEIMFHKIDDLPPIQTKYISNLLKQLFDTQKELSHTKEPNYATNNPNKSTTIKPIYITHEELTSKPYKHHQSLTTSFKKRRSNNHFRHTAKKRETFIASKDVDLVQPQEELE
jgi:hypothetical protein